MHKVLITGAGGFIGRQVAAALDGAARCVPARVDGRRADLLDADDRAALIAAAGADTLVHCAWYTEHRKFWGAAQNTDWEAASVDLFRRFYAAGGRRIVGLGSCAEYDWTTGVARFAEDAALAPHTAYGAAKVRTSQALADLAATAGASWAWARVFYSFGPGEPAARLVPLMIRAVQAGETLEIGPGDTGRDFLAVDVLGRAIAALATSAVEGPVNTASGEVTRFAELAALVERLAGRTGLIIPDRRDIGPNEPRDVIAGVTRLRGEVGFTEAPALADTLRAYMAQV